MNRMLIVVLICLAMVSLAPAICVAESISRGPQSQEEQDRRIQEQKRAIMRRIEQRQAAENLNRLAAASESATTQTQVKEILPSIMREFQKEVDGLRQDVQSLVGKARPQLERALGKAPQTYKLELELTYAKGQTMRMTGYAQDKFQINGPVMRDHETVGSLQFEAELKGPDDGGRIMVQYGTTMDVSIPGPAPGPKAPGQGGPGTSPAVRPVNYRFNTQGTVMLKPGAPKEITSYGESSLKLTLTPD